MRLTIAIICIFAGLIIGIACGGTAEVEHPDNSTSESQTASGGTKAENADIPPTATLAPTNTPVPPTVTVVPTNTPIPPTATPKPTSTPRPTVTPIPTPIPSAYEEITREILLRAARIAEMEEEDTKTVALFRAGRVDISKRCETLGAVYSSTFELLDYLNRTVANNVDALSAEQLIALLEMQDIVSESLDSYNVDFFYVLTECGIAIRYNS